MRIFNKYKECFACDGRGKTVDVAWTCKRCGYGAHGPVPAFPDGEPAVYEFPCTNGCGNMINIERDIQSVFHFIDCVQCRGTGKLRA